MSIVGIDSLIYSVESLGECTRFFEDFGLKKTHGTDTVSQFVLPEGSKVVVRNDADPLLPKTELVDHGVREVIWGVDTPEALDALIVDLSKDREVMRDPDGTAHFMTDFGMPMGLRVFTKKPVFSAPDPLNAPGHIGRLNQHRKWRERAHPKVIGHVVFAVPDYEAASTFMRERLNFQLSDSQKGFGKYLRCDGSIHHHDFLILNANLHLPGMDGKARFHHANFGVDDIDEIMVGANYMVRQGWSPSENGLGRHRLDSALFYYLPSPTGGEAEYGADADCVDDSWVPRDWVEPLFGYAHFVHNLPEFLMVPPQWKVEYLTEHSSPTED
jgi:catechol 2,3-dioxygenase-like lactoylglutathione lyase family enzyme